MRVGQPFHAADLGLLPSKPRVLTSAEVDFVIDVLASGLNFEMALCNGPAQRAIQCRLAKNPRVQDARKRLLAICDQVVPRPIGEADEEGAI